VPTAAAIHVPNSPYGRQYTLGLRYLVAVRPLPEMRRTADKVFPRVKVAVFLDGCFWHSCPEHHRRATGGTAEFWTDKIDGNKRRDADIDQRLHQASWEIIRVWEHEEPTRVAACVRDRRAER
jgi:DNA mismatch endonuclease (patch repair protein)